MKEYLAVIATPYGGGSWARDASKDKAAKRARRIFEADWGHLFKPKRGVKLTANVIEVTGYDTVWFDETGFYSGDTKLDRPIEKIEV